MPIMAAYIQFYSLDPSNNFEFSDRRRTWFPIHTRQDSLSIELCIGAGLPDTTDIYTHTVIYIYIYIYIYIFIYLFI